MHPVEQASPILPPRSLGFSLDSLIVCMIALKNQNDDGHSGMGNNFHFFYLWGQEDIRARQSIVAPWWGYLNTYGKE
jgi:hypothetical protein